MSALPKIPPILARAAKRPSYLGWEHVKRNERDQWIDLNLPLIREWWRAGHENHPHIEYDEADFQPFCRVQFDIERAYFEQLKADGFDDPYAREDE